MNTENIDRILQDAEQKFLTTFSRNLRHYLSVNDMTQKELAEMLGTSNTSVYNWVNGIKSPRMDKVDAMCVIFNCRRSDLISDNPVHEPYEDLTLSREETKIILRYRQMSEAEKNLVCNMMQIKRDEEFLSTRIEKLG